MNCDRSLRAGTPLRLFTRAGTATLGGVLHQQVQVIVWQQARPL